MLSEQTIRSGDMCVCVCVCLVVPVAVVEWHYTMKTTSDETDTGARGMRDGALSKVGGMGKMRKDPGHVSQCAQY